jgi:chemotaxis protein MotB
MSRRRRHEEHENHEAWAIPYGDLVTLLLAFFVVMYAMSTVNEGKYRVLSDSLSEAFNGAPHSTHAVSDAGGSGGGVELPRNQVERLFSSGLPPLVRAAAAAPAPAGASATAPTEAKPSAPAVAAAAGTTGVAGPALGGGAELARVADEVTNAMGTLVAAGEVHVRRLQNSVVVDISTDILFASGVARLSPNAAPALQHLAATLKPFTNALRVEGYTDDRPINTPEFRSNWELSAARAASVVHVFMDRGIAPERLAVMGFGQYRPSATNGTATGRNANRRVAVVILDNAHVPEGTP